MSNNKTTPDRKDVHAFLESVENEKRKQDAYVLLEIMERLSGEEPVMWGPSIVGFGKYHYKYASGREGDWFVTGFSPRKQSMSLYLMSGLGALDSYLGRLGKYRTGKSCLYINKLEDVHMAVLEEMIAANIEKLKAQDD